MATHTTNLSLVTPTTGVTVEQYVTGMNNNMGIIDGITINGKPMAAAINLTASDVGAVPTTRKVNNKPLSADVILSGSDITIPGYAKSSASPLAETDTINEALGKLEALTDEAKLKIATLDKSIADYKTAISELNPNQESTQTATDIGSVMIPKNAGGFVSATIEGLTATNLVTNGDFSNGTTGWLLSNASISNGRVTLTATGATAYVRQTNLYAAGSRTAHKLYMQYKVVSDSLVGTGNFTVGGYDTNDFCDTATLTKNIGINSIIVSVWAGNSNNLTIRINSGFTSGALVLDEISIIDLTAMFGAGNEPSLATCDKRFAKYFAGTKSVIGDCALVSRGKNLFDGELELGYYNSSTGVKVDSTSRIRCKNLQKLGIGTYKMSGLPSADKYIIYYNANKVFLKNDYVSATSATITMTQDGYISFYSVSTNIELSIQLEPGTTSTTYESYKSSTQYISTAEELYSVPNGVCDSITGGLLTRRVQKYTLQAGDITTNYTAFSNIDVVFVKKPTDSNLYNRTSEVSIVGYVTCEGFTPSGGYTDNSANVGKIVNGAATVFHLIVAKGAYANLAAAQSSLAGTVIYYQLATPIEIPIDVSGDLQIYPSGSVTVEQKTVDAGLYDNGISVLKTRLPISALTYISKIDYATGVETPIDESTAVVASGGLSFTHPDLVNGDVVFFEYEFNIAAPVPKLNVSYYDSRYTVLDSVNGKYYRWSVTVANGVPTVAVTEV